MTKIEDVTSYSIVDYELYIYTVGFFITIDLKKVVDFNTGPLNKNNDTDSIYFWFAAEEEVGCKLILSLEDTLILMRVLDDLLGITIK